MNLFAPLPPETRRLLDGIPALIDKAFPLPGRFRSRLPSDVAELSRLLTSGRGERGLSYLGRPNLLSAYLRFFLPWNLYRLCRLLPGLGIELRAGDAVTDLGCGPLTFAGALWICRPDLRALPLEFNCIDRSGPALEAGREFFAALASATLAGEKCPWKIRAVKAELGAGKARQGERSREGGGANEGALERGANGRGGEHGCAHSGARGARSAALVCAINVFNEMHGDVSRANSESLKRGAEKSARMLEGYASAESAVLVVEPGFPRCGEFVGLLRAELMARGRRPLSPCPHDGACPMLEAPAPGGARAGKKRWCHFAFETEDAPKDLQRLSRSAGLPKERAVLSFALAGKRGAAAGAKAPPLEGGQGTAAAGAGAKTPPPEGGQGAASAKASAKAPPGGGERKGEAFAGHGASVLRVISDAFALPGKRLGRYCCSRQGLALLAGEEEAIGKAASGALVSAAFRKGERDPKSGALLARPEAGE